MSKKHLNILFICRRNSCRSQMAEGILRNEHPNFNIYSAGSAPADRIHPFAIKTLRELGIDISEQIPKSLDQLPNLEFDLVFMVCQDNDNCPIFSGNAKHIISIPFKDPESLIGTQNQILNGFRKIRDEIKDQIPEIVENYLKYRIIYYRCPICGLHYDEKTYAEKCEKWCKKSPNRKNLEIISHSLEAKTNFKVF